MNFLETILDHKQVELRERKTRYPIEVLRHSRHYERANLSLAKALRSASPAIIAELKKASPSKGEIRRDFDVQRLAQGYAQGGACAISVLTDERFFSGSLQNLDLARQTVQVPLLRRDFIIDEYQIHEARAHGADAVLLIVAALSSARLLELMREATSLGLESLVEVHSEKESAIAVEAGAVLVGINNRDLQSFTVDLGTTFRIIPTLPSSVTIVSESGISTADQLVRLRQAGVHGFLLGESLMRCENPGAALADLIALTRKGSE